MRKTGIEHRFTVDGDEYVASLAYLGLDGPVGVMMGSNPRWIVTRGERHWTLPGEGRVTDAPEYVRELFLSHRDQGTA